MIHTFQNATHPRIIGHRGVARYAPENTQAGISAAHDMGIKWIEVDAKLSKDSTVIVIHDDTLDRTTSGTGKVTEHNWDKLRQLDAGSWFGESFINTPIPTLQQIIEQSIDLDLGLNIEIKPCPGREIETAEAVMDVISQYYEEDDKENKLLISSFKPQCLETCFEMGQGYQRGLLLGDKFKQFMQNWQELTEHLEISAINVDGNATNDEDLREIINFAQDKSLPVYAYTINDETTAARLLQMGINGFFSDAPDELDLPPLKL